MTRQEYLSGVGTHTDYYNQYVTPDIIAAVVGSIGEEALRTSTDPYMNDIPLRKWDDIRLPPSGINVHMQENGDYLTKAGRVCICKQAARKWLEGQKNETR